GCPEDPAEHYDIDDHFFVRKHCLAPTSSRLSGKAGTILALLFRPFTKKNDLDRFKNDGQVERDREVFDIEEVQLQLPLRIFHGGTVLVLDLCPSGDSRTDGVPLRKEIKSGFQQLAEIGLLRPRTHQAHGAAQDVEELRQLIQTILANKSADAGDAVITIGRPARPAFFGVL